MKIEERKEKVCRKWSDRTGRVKWQGKWRNAMEET